MTQEQIAQSGLSLKLAEHVAHARFESLSAVTVHATCRAILDAVGVMQAASGLAPEVRPFIEIAAFGFGDAASTDSRRGSAGNSVILGVGTRTSAEFAALANGALAHALDFEDAYDAAPVHPNAPLIPAVLALAQNRPATSGKAFITAIAVGCDLACRLARSLRQPLEVGGWYPPPILAAFGAVAGAARILHLNPRQILDAWSLLLMQNSCPGEIKHDADTVLRAVREAIPARAAVSACLLAARGVRGFDAPLEGRAGFFALFASGRYETAELLQGLGQKWLIEDLSFKPWPSCRGTHAAIECALQIKALSGFDQSHIKRIVIEGGEVQSMLALPIERKRAPLTGIDAKFSLPFTVASALVYGPTSLDHFGPGALRSVATLALTKLTEFRLRENRGPDQAVSGAVSIELNNGWQQRREILQPLGSPSRPLDDEALLVKFLECSARAANPLDAAAAVTLSQRLLNLQAEPDINLLPWTAADQ